MFVQLLSALILFVIPIVAYLYAQKKRNTLRNHAVFMVFMGLIFTWTLYVPLHEGGHVIFANLSGIQVTEIVLFFVSETGIRKPAVGLNIDNIDNPLFTLRYVASWAGGILMVSLIFSFISILLYFRRREVLYFSILPILKSFFEIDDLNAISTLIRNWIVPYFVLCGSLLLLIHFFKMSSMLKKEVKVPKRLMFSLSATAIFAVLFWINPLYDVVLLISPLGVCLSQIRMILVIQILGTDLAELWRTLITALGISATATGVWVTSAALIGLCIAVIVFLSNLVQSIRNEGATEEEKDYFRKFLDDLYIEAAGEYKPMIIIRSKDNFLYHKFPKWSLKKDKSTPLLLRGNFDLLKYLAKKLGSTVNINMYEFVERKPLPHLRLFLRLLETMPRSLILILGRSLLVRKLVIKSRIPQRIRAKYVMLYYGLTPYLIIRSSKGNVNIKRDFLITPNYPITYESIKDHENIRAKMKHLKPEVKYSLRSLWNFLKNIRHFRDTLTKAILAESRKIRREHSEIHHRCLEVQNELNWRQLIERRYFRPAVLAILFYPQRHGIPHNRADMFFTSSRLTLLRELQSAIERLMTAVFIFAFTISLSVLGISQSMPNFLIVISLIIYTSAWFFVLSSIRTTWKAVSAKDEQENIERETF